jgi:hypothetical protein
MPPRQLRVKPTPDKTIDTGVSMPLTHPDLGSRLTAAARRIGYPTIWPSPADP